MFIGHYAVSFALKSVEKKISLGLLFIAVQFVDILFFLFSMLGIEHFKIVKHFTQSTNFDLQYFPYTHSLIASFIWGLLSFLILYFFSSGNNISKLKLASLVAIAVISHWFFDLLVHTPDLPLSTNASLKVGFSLWNNAILSYILEAILLLGTVFLYLRSTHAVSLIGKYGMFIFALLMLLMNAINIFAPIDQDASVASVSITALLAYFVFAIIASWLDVKRS